MLDITVIAVPIHEYKETEDTEKCRKNRTLEQKINLFCKKQLAQNVSGVHHTVA